MLLMAGMFGRVEWGEVKSFMQNLINQHCLSYIHIAFLAMTSNTNLHPFVHVISASSYCKYVAHCHKNQVCLAGEPFES